MNDPRARDPQPGSMADAVDLGEILVRLESDDLGRRTTLATSPSFWPAHSGLHTSLLIATGSGDVADAWQTLAEELAEESAHVEDPDLRGALVCEAGRILLDRLGRREEGHPIIARSASPVAKRLLASDSARLGDLAGRLSALESAARDGGSTLEARVAAWIEFGQTCEVEAHASQRAIEAYREALNLIPDDVLALELLVDASVAVGDRAGVDAILERRLATCTVPSLSILRLVERAELARDPAERRTLLERAHAIAERDETVLRGLIRDAVDGGDIARAAPLYLALADAVGDAGSGAIARHLGFLAAIDAGANPAADASWSPWIGAADPEQTLPYLCDVALQLQAHLAAGGELGDLATGVELFDRIVPELDDPREQALAHEQAARLRLAHWRQSGADPEAAEPARIETDLRAALAHLPEHRWPHEALEELLRARGDTTGLVRHLGRWARSSSTGPSRAEIFLRLGQVHEDLRNDLPRAAEVYELAVAEDPGGSSGLRALGRVYQHLRRFPQALASLQRQAKESDEDAERLVILRRIADLAQHELHDPDLAMASLEEVTRSDPDDLPSVYQLAALARTQNRPTVLIATLQLLAERLDDPIVRTEILVELGEVNEFQLKQRDAARAHYAKALELTPGYHPAQRALSRLCRDEGDLETVLRLLDPESDPVADPALLALKAARVCLEELGDVEGAIGQLERAYASDPDLVPARELLLQLLTASGNVRRAYDLLRAQDLPASKPLLADHHYRLGLLAEALARGSEDDEVRLQHQDAALQHHRAAMLIQPDHGLAFERSRRLLVANADAENLARLLEQRAETAKGPARAALLAQCGRLAAREPSGREAARRHYEAGLQAVPNDPCTRRELMGVLRLSGDRTSLPGLYLAEARGTSDTHYKATLLVEAAELLLVTDKPEDRDLAAHAILAALREDPGNPYAVRHLERVLGSGGVRIAIEDAVGARAVRAQSDAERAIFYLESAEMLEYGGAFEAARRAYAAAAEAMPGLLPATLGLQRVRSGAQIAQKRPTAAVASVHVLVAELREIVASAPAPDSPAAARALELLDGVLARDPGSRDAFSAVLALSQHTSDPSPLCAVLDRHFERTSATEIGHDVAMFLADHARRAQQAIPYLDAALARRPDGRAALLAMFGAARAAGMLDRAVDAAERFLVAADPDEPTAIDTRIDLAGLLAERPESSLRALEHARAAYERRPNDGRVLALVVDLLESGGAWREALALLDRALPNVRDPEPLHALYLRKARILAGTEGRAAAALQELQRAAALRPGDRATISLLAAVLDHVEDEELLSQHLPILRGTVMAAVARGDVVPGDFHALSRASEQVIPGLSAMAAVIGFTLRPTSMPPPAAVALPASPTGLHRVLEDPSLRFSVLSGAEQPMLHRLIELVEPLCGALHGLFPVLDPADHAMMPRTVNPTPVLEAAATWAQVLGMPTPELGTSSVLDAVVLLPAEPPQLRLGTDRWLTGDPASWRGLAAVALARLALGGARARSLDPRQFDVLLGGCFEVSEVFHPITADPDSAVLDAATKTLGRQLVRKRRQELAEACRALAGHGFEPGMTARALLATDLRLAMVMTGDVPACLSAACQFDGVPPGPILARVGQSPLCRELLTFLLSDVYLRLRAAACA